MKTKSLILKLVGVFLIIPISLFANPEKDNLTNPDEPLELHRDYVETVYETDNQNEAKFLSDLISKYDVRNSDDFDERDIEFRVVFRSNKGVAHAEYDETGRLLSVKKQLKNVALPMEVLKILSTDYKDWRLVKNKYNVSYAKGSHVSRTYILTLENGTDKQNVKIQI